MAATILVGCSAQHTASLAANGPELFGAGLFSTGAWDFFMAFSPDQHRVLFCRANDDFSAYDIYETHLDPDGHWHAPTKPDFAATWSNADPHISPDGRTVFFISNRPGPGQIGPQATYDIWSVSVRPEGGWGEARLLPTPISTPGVDEFSPAVAASGNLSVGRYDLYVSRREDGILASGATARSRREYSMVRLQPKHLPGRPVALFQQYTPARRSCW